jgi:hypothetical protein
MDRLGPCINTLRALAMTTDPNRVVLIEREIDEYLKTSTISLSHSLERLNKTIRAERALARQEEDWSVARNYSRSLLHRVASFKAS